MLVLSAQLNSTTWDPHSVPLVSNPFGCNATVQFFSVPTSNVGVQDSSVLYFLCMDGAFNVDIFLTCFMCRCVL